MNQEEQLAATRAQDQLSDLSFSQTNPVGEAFILSTMGDLELDMRRGESSEGFLHRVTFGFKFLDFLTQYKLPTMYRDAFSYR